MSEIIPFFTGKHVFITGTTGLVGKLLVEQLLRKCEPAKLYLLIRNKRSQDPAIRMQLLFQEPVFERLKKEKPNFSDKIQIVQGDLAENNLGINENVKTELIENIEIVIHSGATVKFNEPLRVATRINVNGTLSIVNLCHNMKKLQVFVHVSTVYVAFPFMDFEEKHYDPPIGHEELIYAVENFSDEKLKAFEQKFIGKTWPNTYMFSKSIAENLVIISAAALPTVIVRPGIVSCSLAEPKPGWIDNIGAATLCQMAIQLGTNTVFLGSNDFNAGLVPADMTVHCILAAAYNTSLLRSAKNKEEISIYNIVATNPNILTWRESLKRWAEINRNFPHDKIIWLSNRIITINNLYLFALTSFIVDGIPALVVDIVALATNKSARAFKIHRKVNKFLQFVRSITNVKKINHTAHAQTLWNSLCEVDKKLFNFNIMEINWEEYYLVSHYGVIENILKGNPSKNLQEVMKRFNRLRRTQSIMSGFFCCLLLFIFLYINCAIFF